MTDIVTPEVRSRMMSGIRGKNTKPELIVRKALHRQGFRYRLHDPGLPGRPDLVFTRHHAVIFVHGCFWHGHDCPLFRLPATRADFWRQKIDRNRDNDRKNILKLLDENWRVAQVWECAIRGAKRDHSEVMSRLAHWLRDDEPAIEMRR
jgi:DNA mismatch endonuclease (patch repair protein)